MSVMAKYVRIFWPDPKDDDVVRRNAAVTALQAWISAFQDTWSAIRLASALADSVADGKARDVFATRVEKAIVDAGSAAFVREKHDLEIIVVALVTALELVRRNPDGSGWTPADALAAGLWSALSFQAPVAEEPLELLRQELLVAARERTMLVAERARHRAPVPEIGRLSIPENQPTGTRANTAYRKATEPLVKALRENAELDREELEFLWWKTEDWSESLDAPLSDAAPLVRATVAGLDGATLAELLTALDGHRAALAKSIDAERVGGSPTVFPLLAAISTGEAACPGADIERGARDWGARALLEGGILQVATLGGD
jgi:hypothetical protein